MLFDTIITVGLNPTIDHLMEVPGLRIGEHVKARTRALMPAGKAFNVSRALAALGAANCAMGFLGRESVQLFDWAARVAAIDTNWTPIAGRTRENLTLVDPMTGTATHIRDVGPTITQDELRQLTASLESASQSGVLIVFCGSLPPGLTAGDFSSMISACTTRGAAVAVDTSGEALREAIQSSLWLVKPNRSELADLTGHEVTGEQALIAAGRSLAQQIPFVAITSGSDGAYAFADGRCCRAQATTAPEMVRSTVGCGDAFLAGFIAAHQKGLQWENVLAHATAVAAASAMSDLPASFAEEDRLRLLREVKVDAIVADT